MTQDEVLIAALFGLVALWVFWHSTARHWLAYRARHGVTTAKRKALQPRLLPYLTRHKDDRPGQALRRAARRALLAGKITATQAKLFGVTGK